MKKPIWAIAIVGMVMMGWMGCKRAETDLHFSPASGSKYRMVISDQQNMVRETEGKPVDMAGSSEYTLLYETVKASGETSSMKMTLERMKSTDRMEGSESVMDTENKDTADVVAKIMGSVKGAEFTMDINKRGEVTNVGGLDAVWGRMAHSAGSQLSADKSAEMEASLKSMMNEQMLRSMTEQSFKIFPLGKVKVGDTWVVTSKAKSLIDMVVTTTYTLQQVEAGTATLAVSGVITPDGAQKNMDGTMVDQAITGSQTGTLEVETASGMVMHGTIRQNAEGSLKAGRQEMTMKLTGNNTISTTKL